MAPKLLGMLKNKKHFDFFSLSKNTLQFVNRVPISNAYAHEQLYNRRHQSQCTF
jgi:hypothetical protein